MLPALLLTAISLQDEPLSEKDWRVGARLHIFSAFGEPANDIIGGSLYGSYRLTDVFDEDWWATLEVYSGAFDFENPGDTVLGTSNTPTADAKIAMQLITLSVEYHLLDPDSRFDLYLAA